MTVPMADTMQITVSKAMAKRMDATSSTTSDQRAGGRLDEAGEFTTVMASNKKAGPHYRDTRLVGAVPC